MFHYWITDRNSVLLQLYRLNSDNPIVKRKRKVYKTLRRIRTNRIFFIVENEIVDQLEDVEELFNLLEINEKCRVLYNEKYSIVETDQINHEEALRVFSLINDEREELVFVE